MARPAECMSRRQQRGQGEKPKEGGALKHGTSHFYETGWSESATSLVFSGYHRVTALRKRRFSLGAHERRGRAEETARRSLLTIGRTIGRTVLRLAFDAG